MVNRFAAILGLTCLGFAAASGAGAADIVVETDHVRWTLDDKGFQKSFLVKATGRDMAKEHEKPFQFLMVRFGEEWVMPASVAVDGEIWTVTLNDNKGVVRLRVRPEPDHIYIELIPPVPQGAGRIVYTQLSIDVPSGDVGRLWPLFKGDGTHVVFMNLTPNMMSNIGTHRGHVFHAYAMPEAGYDDVKLALVTTPEDKTLETIGRLEQRYGLPHVKLGGEWFRFSNELRKPYLFTDANVHNIDKIIEFARRGNITYILTFSGVWSKSLGHYEIREDNYPGGMEGMKEVVDKIHAAGLKFGLHTLSACIARNDPYLTPKPDPRLAVAREFTLTADIGPDDTAIPVDASPEGMTKVDSYASRGTDLWIGDEVLGYRDYTAAAPFEFTRCVRGRYGTQAAAHKKGEKVRYLHRLYNFFVPDYKSDLVPEIADRIAEVVNTCGVDMLYFDGAEAMSIQGRWWQDAHWIQREVVKRLERDVLVSGSCGSRGFGFHTHMRNVANDGVDVATKLYLTDHKLGIVKNSHRNLTACEIGWLNLVSWTPAYRATQPDEWEFYCLKGFAHDAPISLHMSSRYFYDNGRAGDCLDIIGRYQRAKKEADFSPETIEAIRVPPDEYELVEDPERGWGFVPTRYGPERLIESDRPETQAWTLDNPFEKQPLSLRVRARAGVMPYGHSDNVVLYDPAAESVDWRLGGERGGSAKAEKSNEVLRDGKPTLRVTGRATRNARGTRGYAIKEFDPRPDLSAHRSLGVWVHGDASGGLFDVEIVAPNLIHARDYLIRVDFEGWRYFRLVDAAKEDTIHYMLFRWKGNNRGFDFTQVRELRFQWADMPVDKDCVVHVGRVEALTEVPLPMDNPTLEINGQTVVFPVTLAPDEMLELTPDGKAAHYRKTNDLVGAVAPEGLPVMLESGANQVKMKLEGPAPFAYVSPIYRGAKFLK